MATIVVTGASGFVGRSLVPLLTRRGHSVVDAGRRASGNGRFVDVGNIGPQTNWQAALDGADAVVHLAAIAHRDTGRGANQDVYTEVNDQGTQRLVAAAAQQGVRTVVHISSIFAREVGGHPSAYARSKLASEAHVLRFGETSGTGIVLRPTLVYAHDAPANWRALQRLAASGLPLPFGAVRNRRSFCARENLCDAIDTAVKAGQTGVSGIYEISDREVVSLADILTWMRRGMGIPPRLLPVPTALLGLAGRLTGKSELVTSLVGDLTADPTPFVTAFGWRPPVTTQEGVIESAKAFVAQKR